MSMVSYYNPIGIYRQQQQVSEQQQLAQHSQQQAQPVQQTAGTSSPDGPQQYWYGYAAGYPHTAHHHQTTSTAQQYLEHPESFPNWAHHAHHYSQLHYHQPAAVYQQQPQQQPQAQTSQITAVSQISAVSNEWTGEAEGVRASAAVNAGEPSPPITISGSEISNPGTPSTPPSGSNNGTNTNGLTVNNNPNANRTASNTPVRPAQVRSPFEWMKKTTSYASHPHPGKTRTKDKYRVVYTDHQRLELEKEFHYNRYITMRRKAELAASLGLSDRQVKIWFQNRRAKQRKQMKKREEMDQKELKALQEGLSGSAMAAAINLDGSSHNTMAALNLGALGAMPGMGGMHNAMMPDGSPPHVLAHQPHPLALTHSHQHHHAAHSNTVLGL